MDFLYKLISGHILFQVNGLKVLLDSGAPNSIGSGQLLFLDKNYNLQSNYMGLTTDKLSEYIGTHVDILMGCDIISKYDICIDPNEQKLTFGEHLIDENFMGIPIVQVNIQDNTINAFFDTGAQLSYIDPELTNNYSSTGEKNDFYPGVGRFKTNTFDIPTTIGDEIISIEYGVLPELLQMTLMMADTQGILGSELLNYFGYILSLSRKELLLCKLA
jgi:hypothetical protein